MKTYSYALLSYCPDPTAGESLNIGVVLVCPQDRFVAARFNTDERRYAAAFDPFDKALYRSAMTSFQDALAKISVDEGSDAEEVARAIWPDPGWSFRVSESRMGIGADPREELEGIFEATALGRSILDDAITGPYEEAPAFASVA